MKKPVRRKVENNNNNRPVGMSSLPIDKNGDYFEKIKQIDRNFKKFITSVYGPIDIPAYTRAMFDKYIHLLQNPGTLLHQYIESIFYARNMFSILMNSWMIKSLAKTDKRFSDNLWQMWPYYIFKDTYIETEKFLTSIDKNIRGVEDHTEQILSFLTKQFIELANPANFPFANPVVHTTTVAERGMNLIRGYENLINNLIKNKGKISIRHSREEYYEVGKSLAATPGKVVFRNELIELIQYAPQTDKVHKIPLLIVPAWINKYYILDLRQKNSLVKHLVENGYSVFIISWKNIDSSYMNYDLVDYMKKGTIPAQKRIFEITGAEIINLCGYCLGATLSAITASYLRGQGETSINTLTLLAGQLDFSDAGDLKSFIDESQISFIEDLMEDQGYLNEENLSETFSMLNPRDLYWQFFIEEFFLGREPIDLDFLFWNDDGLRMPKTIHSEILRRLYMNDELTEGKFKVEGKSLDLRDIDMEMYSVGTLKDHIAPWKSVYRTPHFVSSPIKFILSTKGHIAGIINPPEARKGFYYSEGTLGKGPEYWRKTADIHKGSWWNDWFEWLRSRSGPIIKAYDYPEMDKISLADAPGTYVMEK